MKNICFKTCTILVALFIGITLHAQQISVKGTVVEKSTGLSVIGASVIEVGSENNGTITDIDGNFSLTVSQGSELSVSYIGFQAVTVKAQPTVRIEMMEDSQMLNEVVVTGYMSEKKASLTGSVAVVKMKDVADIPTGNILTGLQGRVAGMNITTDGTPGGGNTSTLLRGVTTINNSSPLYVIDGVQTRDNIATILSSNDVESIQVLKDAASAAIYGSRSANGVIIITTKSGQEGKARIDIKYNHSWGTLSHKVPQANRKERLLYDQYRKEYFETYGGGNPDESSDILNDPLNSFFNVDNDYLDMITSTAQKDQVDISVGGGTKKLKYFINTGYYNEKGIISNTGFQRLNTRINSDYSPTDWMNMGSRISLTYSKKKGLNEGTLLSAVLTRRPYFNTYYPDGSLVGVFNGQKNPIAQVNYTTDFTDSYKANFFQFFEIFFIRKNMKRYQKKQFLFKQFMNRITFYL